MLLRPLNLPTLQNQVDKSVWYQWSIMLWPECWVWHVVGGTFCDSPRIPQDDDFQEHFLPGCHFPTAAERQTEKGLAYRAYLDMPSLLVHCLSKLFCIVQGQYNQQIDKPCWKTLVYKCVWRFMTLDQSGLNTIHSSHVPSKLLGKSRGTHHSFSFSLIKHRKLLPGEMTSSLHCKSRPGDISDIFPEITLLPRRPPTAVCDNPSPSFPHFSVQVLPKTACVFWFALWFESVH